MKITKITLTNAKNFIKRKIRKPITNMVIDGDKIVSNTPKTDNKPQVLNKLKNIGKKLKKELWDMVDGIV